MDEVSNENTEPVEENLSEFSTVSDNDEVALESYSQAVLDPVPPRRWLKSIRPFVSRLARLWLTTF